MDGGDGKRLVEPQLGEFGIGSRPAVVIHLVDREKDFLAAGAQFAGNFLVQRHDAFGHIDDHDDGRGHFDGDFGLMPGRVRHQVTAFLVVHERDAARVDNLERFIAPARRGRDAVTGHAGLFMHNGDAPSDDSVEERALPDVGTSDDGENVVRFFHETAKAAFGPQENNSEDQANPPEL